MKKEIIADVNPLEARVALLEDGELVEIQVEMRGHERLVGNIYKGRVANILPGMQAAFVDVGLERNAFLYAGDILADESDFELDVDDIDKKLRPPNIQDILKQGQEIMVQVLKQQGGTKGARVTTHITLPGRLIVLMPTVDHVGVSRRIVNEAERERLKEIFYRIKPEGMGIIVRTVAEGYSEEDFEHEVRFLTRLWSKIKAKSDFLHAPRLIHSEETLLFRTVRDVFTSDVSRFVINDKNYYERVLAVVNITQPHMKKRVELFASHDNIFDRYGVEGKIDKAMQRKVWLKSGSYLVIDETEALTVIDVNTGKYIGDFSLQETILNTNLEAAREIARQLRLRDIGGIIIIDFIDMQSDHNKQLVVEELEQALKKDRTKTNVLGMTELGLVEMTRKKVRRKLSAIVTVNCENCAGSGRVYSPATMAMRVRREVIRVAGQSDARGYIVEVASQVAAYIAQKNAQNEAILPPFEGKTFFLMENRFAHMHEINVSPILDARQMDLVGREAQVFN